MVLHDIFVIKIRKEVSINKFIFQLSSCQDSLLKHGIDYKKCSHLPDVQLKLPKLEGNDVVEHFYNIGEQQSAPYRELLKRLANCELPPMPKVSRFNSS